jgi:RNA polymerase sigma-70 factor (ECF subfamily)
MIRARKVRSEYFNRIAQIGADLAVQQPILFNELDSIFQEVLQSLPADQQEIFRLLREESLSYKEVAELKGISVKTVEKKMSLSLKAFRLKLGEVMSLLVTILFF